MARSIGATENTRPENNGQSREEQRCTENDALRNDGQTLNKISGSGKVQTEK